MAKEKTRVELVMCPDCNGSGEDLFTGKDCPECAGHGFVPEEVEGIDIDCNERLKDFIDIP